MKKLLFTACGIVAAFFSFSQVTDTSRLGTPENTPAKVPNRWQTVELANRSNDHFMLQYGFDGWSGTNDTISPSGFSRHFNFYFMLDKPFKTNPKFSVGLGLGIGSSNIFFDRTYVNVKSTGTRLPFTRQDSTNHFKKFKLTTVFFEAPVELRYTSNPLNSNKAFKMALGVKVGTMIDAHTKGKTLQDKNGTTINSYIQKEKSRRFFNSTRLALTGRVGIGVFSVTGAYQVTGLLKDGAGPAINPYSIGIGISGL